MARVVKYDGDIPCLELIDTTGQTVRNYAHVYDMCVFMKEIRYYTVFLSSCAFDNIPGHLAFTPGMRQDT